MNIEERLSRLETVVRRQRQGFCLLVLAAIALLTVGPAPAAQPDAPPKALTVGKLSIQDSKGRDRVILAEGTILFKDEKGIERIALFTNENHVAELEFFDSKGIPRIQTSTGADGIAVSGFYDVSGPSRIVTGVDDKGGAFSRFNDSKGRRRYDLGTSGDDQALEVFYDLNDNALINAGVVKGKALVKLFDASGKLLAAQP